MSRGAEKPNGVIREVLFEDVARAEGRVSSRVVEHSLPPLLVLVNECTQYDTEMDWPTRAVQN